MPWKYWSEVRCPAVLSATGRVRTSWPPPVNAVPPFLDTERTIALWQGGAGGGAGAGRAPPPWPPPGTAVPPFLDTERTIALWQAPAVLTPVYRRPPVVVLTPAG